MAVGILFHFLGRYSAHIANIALAFPLTLHRRTEYLKEKILPNNKLVVAIFTVQQFQLVGKDSSLGNIILIFNIKSKQTLVRPNLRSIYRPYLAVYLTYICGSTMGAASNNLGNNRRHPE